MKHIKNILDKIADNIGEHGIRYLVVILLLMIAVFMGGVAWAIIKLL